MLTVKTSVLPAMLLTVEVNNDFLEIMADKYYYANIDLALTNKAEEEICALLIKQQSQFEARWRSNRFAKLSFKVLETLGIALSILGIILIIFGYFFNSTWCPTWASNKPFWYLAFFVGTLLLFAFLPSAEKPLIKKLKSFSEKNCLRHAQRFIQKAKNACPFQARYELCGDGLKYFRDKSNEPQSQQVIWHRQLHGVVYYGQYVSLFFKNWHSLQPSIIVLHENFANFKEVLDAVDIHYRPIDA